MKHSPTDRKQQTKHNCNHYQTIFNYPMCLLVDVESNSQGSHVTLELLPPCCQIMCLYPNHQSDNKTIIRQSATWCCISNQQHLLFLQRKLNLFTCNSEVCNVTPLCLYEFGNDSSISCLLGSEIGWRWRV